MRPGRTQAGMSSYQSPHISFHAFTWDRPKNELRSVWLRLGRRTRHELCLQEKLAPARVSYQDGSLISYRVCTRMVCVVPCGSYTARHCKWWPIYHLLFHSDKKFLKGVVSGLFCLRSTPVSCLISSASTSQVYTATQMTHSCIWHSVLVRKGRTRAR